MHAELANPPDHGPVEQPVQDDQDDQDDQYDQEHEEEDDKNGGVPDRRLTHEAQAYEPNARVIETLMIQLAEKDKLLSQLIHERTKPYFVDLGWGAFNIDLIEAVGEWAEQHDPAEQSDDVQPRIRVRGESFSISREELLFLQSELGIQAPKTDSHDKFAALVDQDSCLNRAQFGEPIFILRAQDELAAQLVRDWADRAEAAGCGAAKLADARHVAELMESYPGRKSPD